MPELPEVETVRRGLEPALKNGRVIRCVVNRRDLRAKVPGNFSKKIEGRKIITVGRRGKYIVVLQDGGGGFSIHLGMSGRVKIFPCGEVYNPEKHDHVIFEIDNGSRVVFNDPRRFGMVFAVGTKWENEKPFAAMGPEPLGREFSAKIFLEKLKGRKSNIKAALLDQNVVAGVGNIYACEALYHAGIDPGRVAGSLGMVEARSLVAVIKAVLKKAIKAGGSTLRDHRKTDGSLGYFQHQFSVYDREGQACSGCRCDISRTGGVQRIVQGGRSTFYCREKQK